MDDINTLKSIMRRIYIQHAYIVENIFMYVITFTELIFLIHILSCMWMSIGQAEIDHDSGFYHDNHISWIISAGI